MVRSTSARRAAPVLVAVLLIGVLGAGCSDDVLEQRPYQVHLPPGYRPREHSPLLVLLHGYGQTGASVSSYFDVFPVTDANRMLVVAPDGTTDQQGKQYWHATGACCGPPDSDVDDLGYLRAILTDVRKRYRIDPKRIFFMGHSNGAFMSYQMACHEADVVAAVVAFAGSMTVGEPCEPSEPVSVAQIHGTADPIIHYDGGFWKESTEAYMSAPASVRTWADLDGCSTTPEDPPPASHDLVVGGPPATVTAYGSCDRNARAELWTIPGADHDPPLAPGFSEDAIGFLLAHPKP
jgi:polyhydroxybutyrate depolymerase